MHMPSLCHFRERTPNRHWMSVRVLRGVSALGQQAPRPAIPETERAAPVHSTEEVRAQIPVSGLAIRFACRNRVARQIATASGELDPAVRMISGRVLTVFKPAFARRDLPTKFRIF